MSNNQLTPAGLFPESLAALPHSPFLVTDLLRLYVHFKGNVDALFKADSTLDLQKLVHFLSAPTALGPNQGLWSGTVMATLKMPDISRNMYQCYRPILRRHEDQWVTTGQIRDALERIQLLRPKKRFYVLNISYNQELSAADIENLQLSNANHFLLLFNTDTSYMSNKAVKSNAEFGHHYVAFWLRFNARTRQIKRLYYFDPLGKTYSMEVLEQRLIHTINVLKKHLFLKWPEPAVTYFDRCLQTDGHSCGLWVIWWAEQLAKGVTLQEMLSLKYPLPRNSGELYSMYFSVVDSFNALDAADLKAIQDEHEREKNNKHAHV